MSEKRAKMGCRLPEAHAGMLEKAFLKVDMITLTKHPTSKRGGCGQLNNGGSPSVRESGRRVTALAARRVQMMSCARLRKFRSCRGHSSVASLKRTSMKKQGWLRWLAVAGWRWCAGAGCGWQALMLLWRWHSSGSLMLWLAGYAWLWQAVAGWCDGAQWRCADGWHPSLLRSNRGYRRGHRYISRTTSTARRTVTVVRSQPLPAPGILSEHAAGALRQRPAHGSATRTLPTAQVLPVMWSWGWGRGRPPSPRHPLGFQGITK